MNPSIFSIFLFHIIQNALRLFQRCASTYLSQCPQRSWCHPISWFSWCAGKRPRNAEEAAAVAPPPKKRRGRPRKSEQQGVPYRLTCVHLCQSGALFFGEGGARKCATCVEHWDDSEREWRRHPERQWA
jgi:hypothetical protein